jgi:hypothetical protein
MLARLVIYTPAGDAQPCSLQQIYLGDHHVDVQ